MKHKFNVFVCYSSPDKNLVQGLCSELRKVNWVDLWLAEERLLPGQVWEDEIQKAIESVDFVVMCISKDSLNKEGYVQREIRKVLEVSSYKSDERIFVIVVRLDDCELPESLKAFQMTDYFPVEEQRQTINYLLKSLNLNYDTLKVQEFDEGVQWFNLWWWSNQIKKGLKGPRAVVAIVLALIGAPCSLCPYLFGCPIHIPILAIFAGFFSVRQERIHSRRNGGIIGSTSAMIVALIQIFLSSFANICLLVFAFSFVNPVTILSESNYTIPELSVLWPLGFLGTFIIYIIVFIFTGIIGYFSGYLSVTVE